MVEEKAGLPVTIVSPDRRGTRARHLKASAYRAIRKKVLEESQFLSELTDSLGTFSKPASW